MVGSFEAAALVGKELLMTVGRNTPQFGDYRPQRCA
jgi:hypothetical protein